MNEQKCPGAPRSALPPPPVPRYIVFTPYNSGTWGDQKPTYILAMRVAQALARNTEWRDKYCVLLLCRADSPKEQFIFQLAKFLFGNPLTKTDPTPIFTNLSKFGNMDPRRTYITTKTNTWTAEGSCFIIMSQDIISHDFWSSMKTKRIEGRPFFFNTGRCTGHTIEVEMESSFSCDYAVSYGDNGPARNLRFALSCLDGDSYKARYAPLMLPPQTAPTFYFSAEKSYKSILTWVKEMKFKGFKILGFAISRLTYRWLHVLSAFLVTISETGWAVVMLGPPYGCLDPNIQKSGLLSECSDKYVIHKKSRIYVPESYIEYEDLVPLCDYAIVGLGAGSVTVPIVFGVPFTTINVRDSGLDKSSNQAVIKEANIGVGASLYDLIDKEKLKSFLNTIIDEKSLATYKTNLKTLAETKNGGVTKDTYDELCQTSINKFINDNIACDTCGLIKAPPANKKRKNPPAHTQ